MWIAKHQKDCHVSDRYFIVRNFAMQEDSIGNYLNGDTKGEVVRAVCDECGAKAKWVKEDNI